MELVCERSALKSTGGVDELVVGKHKTHRLYRGVLPGAPEVETLDRLCDSVIDLADSAPLVV